MTATCKRGADWVVLSLAKDENRDTLALAKGYG